VSPKSLLSSLVVFLLSVSLSPAAQPKKVLLLAGEKSHGPGAHEHLAGMNVLAKCLDGVPGLEAEVVDVSGKWEQGPELIRKADGIVMYLDFGMRWEQIDPERKAALEDLMSRGGGVVALHWAVENARRLVAQAVLWTVGLPIPKDGLPVAISEKDLELPSPEKQ